MTAEVEWAPPASHARARAVRLSGGALETLTMTPANVGFAPAPLAKIRGGAPEENAARLKALLQGRGTRTEKQAVAINAGALLFTAGKAATLADGAALALDILASGAAHERLEALVAISNG